MYVLVRTDQGGGYVARPGSQHSYTRRLEEAQTFPSREVAERGKCENEVARSVEEILGGGRRPF